MALAPPQPTDPSAKPPAPRGALASFASRADDKNWDLRRRQRAEKYQMRMDTWRRANRAWKKGGGIFGPTTPRAPQPGAPPAELAPYVKGVVGWGLAKADPNQPRDENGRWTAGAGAAAATGLTVKLARAGAERTLGVQRFVHGSSSKAISSIMKTGLDPLHGGAAHGSSASIKDSFFRATSKNRIHVAKDNIIGRRGVANVHGALAQDLENGKHLQTGKKAFLVGLKGSLFLNPWRNRVGGAVPHESFKQAFEQDPWHIKGAAFAGKPGIGIGPENLRRSRAGFTQIVRARSPNLGAYIKGNRGRFGLGVAALGAAAGLGAIAVSQGRKALGKFFDESKVSRDDHGRFADRPSRMTGAAPRPRHVASIYARGKPWEDREKPERDPLAAVRPTKDMTPAQREAYGALRDKWRAGDLPPPKGHNGAPAKAPMSEGERQAGGIYERRVRTVRVPKELGEQKVVELTRAAIERTRTLFDEVMEAPRAQRLIPEGTPKKDVRDAWNRARDIVLHEIGPIALEPTVNRMNAADIERLKPLHGFVKYARRKMNDVLRAEFPGAWAPFRREFGKPFSPAKFYAKDTQGQKAGEEKKRFYRWEDHTLLKAVPVVRSRRHRPLTEAERQQRREAARARWGAEGKGDLYFLRQKSQAWGQADHEEFARRMRPSVMAPHPPGVEAAEEAKYQAWRAERTAPKQAAAIDPKPRVTATPTPPVNPHGGIVNRSVRSFGWKGKLGLGAAAFTAGAGAGYLIGRRRASA